jgi:uncharacterized protein YdbL (DUF1318 family)
MDTQNSSNNQSFNNRRKRKYKNIYTRNHIEINDFRRSPGNDLLRASTSEL